MLVYALFKQRLVGKLYETIVLGYLILEFCAHTTAAISLIELHYELL